MISPLLAVVLPLAIAPLAYIVRRWAWAGGVLAALTASLAARLFLSTPFDWSGQLFGRELALEPASRAFLIFAFGLSAVMFLYAWQISPGWSFFPFTLTVLGFLSGALLLRNFSLSVLLAELGFILMVFLVQSGRRGSVRAALRYLTMVVLAGPPLLLAAQLFPLLQARPDDEMLVQLCVALLAFGGGILWGLVPFQGWLSALGAEAPPLVSAFIGSAGQGAIFFLFLGTFKQHDWLLEGELFYRILLWGGFLSACAGGFLALFQRDFGRLLGYSLLGDMGCILMVWGTHPAGPVLAAFHFTGRSIAVVLLAMGLSAVRHHAGSDAFAELGGVARRLPFATFALIGGGLSLSGFPLSAGFASRWFLGQALSERQFFASFIFLAGAGAVLSYLRGLAAMLAGQDGGAERRWKEPFVVKALILIMALASLVLGLYPRPVLQVIGIMIEGYTFTLP
ncbi:MAG: proton-conducting transporter transmembrane domain-containing protein [Anaerolineae bacterium]